jgi:hypothetical protein
MTIEKAREVLATSCGHKREWFAHRAAWVREAIAVVMRSSQSTEDDVTIAVSVELSMHGHTDRARSVLLN